MINKYFPDLSSIQQQQCAGLESVYRYWNSRVNLISRKDIDNLLVHHLLHSLSIARFIRFSPGTIIMDAGTGGGFPGIPLAIYFPDVQFWLVDSIGKKIKAVTEIIKEINLPNARPVHARFETLKTSFDFITGRAVSNLEKFVTMTKPMLQITQRNEKPNGIFYLAGNTVEQRGLSEFRLIITPIARYFPEPFFSTKALFYLPMQTPCG